MVAVVFILHGPLHGLRVVLDPGHGGSDSGMTWERNGHRYTEASCAYKLTAELGEALRKLGAEVEYTVISRALQPSGTKLTQPTDARYTINHKRVHPGIHGCSVRAQGWDGKRNTVFLSLHIDQFPGDALARGGVVYRDTGMDAPKLAHLLADQLRWRGMGRIIDKTWQPLIQAEQLVVLNREANPLAQRVLYEVASPRYSLSDHDFVTTRAGRSKIIGVIAMALRQYNQGF